MSNVLTRTGVVHGLATVLEINHNRCDYLHMVAFMVRRCCGGFFGKHCEACPAGRGRRGGALFPVTAPASDECLCKSGRCSDGPWGTGPAPARSAGKASSATKIESSTGDLCGAARCHTQCNGGPLQGGERRVQPQRRVDQPVSGRDRGCHANADCIHAGPNKTLCTCHQGYTGDGQKCELIDLCLKNKGACHRAARCNMTGPGVRTCTCYPGYIGDGIACKGTVTKVSEGDEEGTGEEEGEGCIATPIVGNT
ncbi:hypothetical protein CRUP_025345 [Coryphaenoides rupestris]|nr:hypothetical protein CRUP_025345 [Coryphaenoides rupestris]